MISITQQIYLPRHEELEKRWHNLYVNSDTLTSIVMIYLYLSKYYRVKLLIKNTSGE